MRNDEERRNENMDEETARKDDERGNRSCPDETFYRNSYKCDSISRPRTRNFLSRKPIVKPEIRKILTDDEKRQVLVCSHKHRFALSRLSFDFSSTDHR